MSSFLILSVTVFVIWIWIRRSRDRIPVVPKPWPLLGSTLELTANFHRLYDWITDYAMKIPTFQASHMGFRFFFTVDPVNVEYILKTKFDNFTKGSAAHEIQYDFLGDGIFNTDGEMWRLQRKSARLDFSSKMLRLYSTEIFRKYAVKLNSVLEQEAINGAVVNMQDLLMRMTFDSIGELSFGVEIGSLVSSLPDLPFVSAFDRSNALCASRYFDPFWKFKKYFSIGSEAKVKEDVRVLDNFIYPLIQKRKQSIHDNEVNSESDLNKAFELLYPNLLQVISESDLLSRILLMAKENPELYDDRKMRDAVLNFLFAGRDGTAITLSWLLWLLSQNSEVEEKIVEELQIIPGLSGAAINENDVSCFEKYSELLTYDVLNNKMHYLHAAITETLRLYPAVPLDGKSAVSDDILPDGSKIAKGNVIFYVPYAMGRMQRLWGNDALEFKPERWLNEDGIFQPQSPFKFTAFQAGPRNCIGKDSAYLQMKMAAALLLRFFRFDMVKDHRVKYRVALTLVMPSLPMIGHRRGSRLR